MEWKKFLVKFYNEKKAEDPEFKFKDAMKAAKGPYRKQLSGGAEPITETVPEQPMAGGKRRKSSRRQLSGGADEIPPPPPVEGAPATETPVTGGKKSRRKRSAKRRTSKKR
jgi:hypothetical protein